MNRNTRTALRKFFIVEMSLGILVLLMLQKMPRDNTWWNCLAVAITFVFHPIIVEAKEWWQKNRTMQ